MYVTPRSTSAAAPEGTLAERGAPGVEGSRGERGEGALSGAATGVGEEEGVVGAEEGEEGAAGEVGALGVVPEIIVPSISNPEGMGSVEEGLSPEAMAESMKAAKRVLSPNKFVIARTGVVGSASGSSAEVTLNTIWKFPKPAGTTETKTRETSTSMAVAAEDAT